jgi:hypothetical protein
VRVPIPKAALARCAVTVAVPGDGTLFESGSTSVRSGIAPAPAFASRFGAARGRGKRPARKAQRTFPTQGGAGPASPELRGTGAPHSKTLRNCGDEMTDGVTIL